jgi:hypothetical protein
MHRRLRRCLPSRRAVLASAAILIAVTLVGCQRATEPVVTPAQTFTGRWIGQSWEGEASATLFLGGAAGDTLYVFGVQRVPEEWVRLRVVFRGVGTYALGPDDVVLETLVGGDVVVASYPGIGPTAGTIEVTSYGPGGLVEGTFTFDARMARTA